MLLNVMVCKPIRDTGTYLKCITNSGENPYEVPMRIYPAVHYTMGGLWVDYNLQSTIPGLHVAGEAGYSDHGANRLGASALMQGLADGYFVLPQTIGNYLAKVKVDHLDTSHPAFTEAKDAAQAHLDKLMGIKGSRSGLFPQRAWKDYVGILWYG